MNLPAWLIAKTRRAISVGGIAAITELNIQIGTLDNDADHYFDALISAAWSQVISHGVAAAAIMVIAPAALMALRRLGGRGGTEPLHANWILDPPAAEQNKDQF